MSSALCHVSQGMAGATGAPRPTLVNWAGGVSLPEHEVNRIANSAASAARLRVAVYRYRFTDPATRRETAAWWTRMLEGYL